MTVTLIAGTDMPIRLRRPPLLEPPFDDEPVHVDQVPAPELPLDWRPSTQVRTDAVAPTMPVSQVGISPVHIPATGGPAPTPGASAAKTRREPGGDAAATAQRYVQVCLEVLNGFRPAAHLRTLTGPVEFTAVVGQLARRRNGRGRFPTTGPGSPHTGPGSSAAVGAYVPGRSGQPAGPLATSAHSAAHRYAMPAPPATPAAHPYAMSSPAAAPAAHGVNRGPATAQPATAGRAAVRNSGRATEPYRLLRLRLSEPREGVAEVVAVLSHAGMSLAVAMRLERHGERWQCALVQII